MLFWLYASELKDKTLSQTQFLERLKQVFIKNPPGLSTADSVPGNICINQCNLMRNVRFELHVMFSLQAQERDRI